MQIKIVLIQECFKMRSCFTNTTHFDGISLHILLKLMF